MTYEAWRISYQSSEQAARAAYAECECLRAKIESMEQQAIVAYGVQQTPSVPDGWKLVPIEPTVKIRKAMHYAYWQKQSPQMPYHDGSTELWNAAYAAMLAAAPEAKP